MEIDFSRFQAVVFDLDGTLALTEHVWQSAKKIVAQNYGVEVSSHVLDSHVGRRLVDFVTEEILETSAPIGKINSVTAEIEALATSRLPTALTPVPGAVQFVRLVAAQGMHLAICSSAPLASIDIVLNVLEIRDCFAEIVSSANMPIGKPDPAPYLKTVEILGISATNTLAIEDSLTGVRSAKGAGLTTFAIGDDISVVDSGLADAVFSSFAELTKNCRFG